MTEKWLPQFYDDVMIKVGRAFADKGPIPDSVGDAVRKAINETAMAAFQHSERVALEAAQAARAMGEGLPRPEEVSLHNRRALEGTRIARSLAALRVSVESAVDVAPELEALAAAVGATDHVLEGGQAEEEDGPDSLDEIVEDLEALEGIKPEEIRAIQKGTLDVGPHVVTILAGSGVMPDLELLARVGICEVELTGPVRCVEATSKSKGGETTREIVLRVPSIMVAAGVRVQR